MAEIAISEIPHMPPEAIAEFSKRLSSSTILLEYGSGGSSVYAARHGIRRIFSVDSDRTFLKAVESTIAKGTHTPDVYYPVYVDIGKTGKWGVPLDKTSAAKWPRYCAEPWKIMRNQSVDPNLVLVDGRFRKSCFLTSLLFATPGTPILWDDYSDRPHYHDVEAILKPIALAERMGVFIVPPAIHVESLVMAILDSVADPR